MEKKDLTFTFDPNDLGSMCELMDKYGDSDTMFMGVNTEFEETEIFIFPDKIVYATYQKRENVYWRDGTREETFKGRWKPGN